MTNLKTIGICVLGIVISIGIQWLSLLTLFIFKVDPLFDRIFYTSFGLLISIVLTTYLLFRKKWWLASGIIIGTLLWYPFFAELLAIGGL